MSEIERQELEPSYTNLSPDQSGRRSLFWDDEFDALTAAVEHLEHSWRSCTRAVIVD